MSNRLVQDKKEFQSAPSRDPFASKLVPFASPPPAFGAVKALFQAGEGWELDEEENPRFVHTINGAKMRGAFSYHVVLPEHAVGETVPLAHKELAFEILKNMGVDTVWLHVALLAYAIERPNENKPFVIPSARLYRLFGLDRRKDMTTTEKDLHCFKQLEVLRRLGIAILHLEVNGQEANYRHSLGTMWDLAFEEHGQRYLSPETITNEESSWTRRYDNWQVIGRPGMVWANLFLYNEDQLRPIRQFGVMAREMLEKIDRYRAPLAAALAIMLTFFSRFGGKAFIPVTNRQILEFGGECTAPTNRDQKRKIKTRLLSAIEEQRRWGWTPSYEDWPRALRPDLAANQANSIVQGDGSEALPSNLPRGYWEQLLECNTCFSPPPDILEKHSQYSNPRKLLFGAATDIAPVKREADLEFKECYQSLIKLGLSQKKIANNLDVSQSMVSRWCNGERKISKQSLLQLQELLGQTRRARRLSTPASAVTSPVTTLS